MEFRYVFSGNRIEVFKKMLEYELKIFKVLAIENSYLHKYLIEIKYKDFEVIKSKTHLINTLNLLEFDIFIANGLPYILPISKLKAGNHKRFINIHPSFLPDLKGADPIPGSLLFARDSGATCHEMDDGIDTGEIISQYKIDYNKNIDCSLLYLLCFKAEAKVFEEALKNNFKIQFNQELTNNLIYYSFKEKDRIINLKESAKDFIRKVNAFSNKSKGAILKINEKELLIYSAYEIQNETFDELFMDAKNATIILSYEESFLLKWNSNYIKVQSYKRIV